MLEKVQQDIVQKALFSPTDQVLMAVSGGRDSMCMAVILHRLGYQVSVAHCNFQLRGKDADADEQFVKAWSEEHQIPFCSIRFQTEQYAQEHQLSTQMAARELRYNWFEELSQQHQFNKIAIAHNADDVAETFFINLIRGTGLDGLTGIKAKLGKIVRPLLGVSRNEINNFIQKNQILYKEDVTNASVKYLRNKIRHHILPEFRSISGSFNQTLLENIAHLNDSKTIVDKEIATLKKRLFQSKNNLVYIPISELKKLDPLSVYLYELLKPYHFSKSVVENIAEGLNAESGKQFCSETHQITKDRDCLILFDLQVIKSNIPSVFIREQTENITRHHHLKISVTNDNTIVRDVSVACLDKAKLVFPLELRNWQSGDYFMPLGMSQRQKISDYLINAKVPLIEKEQTEVLVSGNDIVWLVGHRIDHRYKITESTEAVFKIEIQEQV